jgi:hypothetical protein
MNTDFVTDIPLALAHAAHAGSSFVPEQRAEQVRNGYAAELATIYDELKKHATTPEKLATLEAEFARFREGYAKRYRALLASQSRTYSVMIAGPSNFPARRMEKRNRVVNARRTELIEFVPRAKSAILKVLHPELRPVMTGDSDAVERLHEKIAKAEQEQERHKAINAAIRQNAKKGIDAQVAAIMTLGLSEKTALGLLEPDFCGRLGIPAYELTNNNANIRRMKERLEQITRNRQMEEMSFKGESATVEDCPADNRVRIFFQGKPPEAIRTELKKSGFRWSPSIGAWQAYRHGHTIAKAKSFLLGKRDL